MVRISRRALAVAAVAAAQIAMTCIASTAAAQKVLRVVPHADLKNIDPIWTTAYITRNHGYMVYDTLFALDKDLKPQPQMVDTWSTSKDGLTWTFTLRPGLKWHDGKPVTAADCVASLKRWGKRDGMGQVLMDVVSSLRALNERTIEMKLTEPFGLVLEALGKISSNVPFMMPERLAQTDPFQQVPEIIGSGPFIFKKEQWRPGAKVVYVKNPDYIPRAEPPSGAAGAKIAKVERVEWIYIPDSQTAMNALIGGEVDYYENPPPDLAPIMESSPGIIVEVTDPLGNQGMLRMNHLLPPFNNPKIRQAVLHTIDQEMYLRTGIGDPRFFRICHSVYACGTPLESDIGYGSFKKANLAAARKLLAEGKYDGTPVVIMQPTDVPMLSAFSLVTAQRLREIGMKVDLQAMDWSTLTSRRAKKDPVDKGGWNIFHTWWIGGDITNPILANVMSGGGEERAWFGWPTDAQIEQLRRAFARESNPAKRKALAEKIQVRAMEIGTHGNVGTFFIPIAYRDHVKGIIRSPVPFFWNIDVKR